MRTAIEHVGTALILEPAPGHRKEHRHQRRRPVDHGRVDHLAFAGARRFEQSAYQAVREEHPAAAEIADQVERRHRLAAGFADRVQGARQSDVVDVVTRRVRNRAFLAPPRHASIDQPFVARHAVVGAESQTLRDTGPEPFEQAIRGFHQLQDKLDAFRLFQVDGNRPAVPGEYVATAPGTADPIDPDHLRAHIRQHHAAERPRADARQFDDAKTLQRSHDCSPLVCGCAEFKRPRTLSDMESSALIETLTIEAC